MEKVENLINCSIIVICQFVLFSCTTHLVSIPQKDNSHYYLNIRNKKVEIIDGEQRKCSFTIKYKNRNKGTAVCAYLAGDSLLIKKLSLNENSAIVFNDCIFILASKPNNNLHLFYYPHFPTEKHLDSILKRSDIP